MKRVFRNLSIYLLLVLVVIFLFNPFNNDEEPIRELTFTEMMAYIEQDKIYSVDVIMREDIYIIEGKFRDEEPFEVNTPPNAELLNQMADLGIQVTSVQQPESPWWMGFLGTFLIMLLLLGLILFMMQQTQGGGNRVMQFGKSKAKMQSGEKSNVTFKDVAGADEVREELEEVVEFLKYPRKFNDIGAKIPKGVLLFGPPGTGKTLLARAVAGEAGVPFFSISGSDFVEMFVGVGASRVRDLFENAKKNAPCIVFIDEIDAVGRQRGAGLGGGHDEREQTLNQLLVEMDGFEKNEGIIIVAATNRPDILDPALLRPGRFDRQITVDVPDVKGREEILKVHAKERPLASDVNLSILARRTPGFTGADLQNLINEAALLAARHGRKDIGMRELEVSIERVIAGPEKKSRVINENERRLVAYHEAGHALTANYLKNTDSVHKVSIIPRGRAGGYCLTLPKEDRNYMTKSQILDSVVMLLGGRVAEAVVLKEISTGAQNDLERATELVRKLITVYGMSDELGPLTFGKGQGQVFLGRDISRDRDYSEAVAFSIDKEARRIMDESYNRAKQILTDKIEELHLVAKTLMDKETLEADEFDILINGMAEGLSPEEAREKLDKFVEQRDKGQNGKSLDDAGERDKDVQDSPAPEEREDPKVTFKYLK